MKKLAVFVIFSFLIILSLQQTAFAQVEEYHGAVDCQYCNRPMSHNIKTGGEFKVVYVKCGCSRSS